MASTLVFWLFLAFLVGGGTLVMVLSYHSVEEQRARDERRQAEQARARREMAAVPRFFVVQPATELPSADSVLNDALLASLQSYVRSEQAIAAQFVDEPSIDSLYRQSGPSMFVH